MKFLKQFHPILIIDHVFYIFYKLVAGLRIFLKSKMNLIAGAGTLYLILCSFPIILFLAQALGHFFGNTSFVNNQILSFIKESFPELSPIIVQNIKMILEGRFRSRGMDFVNLIVFLWASYSFINVCLNGLQFISNKENLFQLKDKLIRATSILTLIMAGILFLMLITPISLFMVKIAQNNIIVEFLDQNLPQATILYRGFLTKVNFEGQIQYLLRTNFIHGSIIVFLFTIFFKWIFPNKKKFIDAFSGALSFAALFSVGKAFFWVYLFYAREKLLMNYGDFYTLVVVVIWLYFLMCSFFYSLCVVYADLNYFSSFTKELVSKRS